MIEIRTYLLLFFLLSIYVTKSQTYPSYGQEIDVTINGLTSDAMEPFISFDGNYLFFNNLNDGINTKLYYSTKVNDSTFTFIGELNGTNQPAPPHLDAVADMDSLNNFYWTSTRNYPAELHNLFHGTFNSGNVNGIGRVHGDINKNVAGWLIMDHGISFDGQFLYFNNAKFGGNCLGPCETELGVAQKINDSTFNALPNSDGILQNINDTNYIYYAPCISSDNLELYYTRYLKDTITLGTLFEICVSVRRSASDTFSLPAVLFSEFISDLIEAPTLTRDKKVMYYHKKIIGSHKIVMRYRDIPLGIESPTEAENTFSVYPNPAGNQIVLEVHNISINNFFVIIDERGNIVKEKESVCTNRMEIDIENLSKGPYFIKFFEKSRGIETIKFIKN